MENTFYFNKELLPFYLWAFGGILLCTFALLRIYSFRRKHKINLSPEDSPVWCKYKALQNKLLFCIAGYMFCAVLLIGFTINSVPLCIYGSGLLICFLITFSNFLRK